MFNNIFNKAAGQLQAFIAALLGLQVIRPVVSSNFRYRQDNLSATGTITLAERKRRNSHRKIVRAAKRARKSW